MSLETRIISLVQNVAADIKSIYISLAGKVNDNDARLTNSREWSEETISQAEAEAGTATTRRAWTAQRVKQAIVAWWNSSKESLSGPVAISANSGSPALKVTQLGTGHCFLVEDTSTDTAPLVVDATGALYVQSDFSTVGLKLIAGNIANLRSTAAPFDIDNLIQDGVGASTIRFFRSTATTGDVSVAIGLGNGSTAANHLLFGNKNLISRVSYNNGSVELGNAAGYVKSIGTQIAGAGVARTPTRSTAASGSTINLTAATSVLIYDNAATVAALTVNLPSTSLTDGHIMAVNTSSAVTAFTLGGGTIYGAPTAMPANGHIEFIYSTAANAWFKHCT